MPEPITINALASTGRVDIRDPNLGNTFSVLNADFSSDADITVDFGVQSQGQTFGIVRSLFMDNGTNPEAVDVYVSGTDQFFTIPAYSIGYYTIDANASSRLRLVTAGGATDVCTVIFYNWPRDPVVWYSFGAFNSDRPIKTFGTMEEGDTIASTAFNNPVYIGGKTPSGDFIGLNTDAFGNLTVSNLAITIGAIYGADAIGTVPTYPGVLMSVLDSTGEVKNLALDVNNRLPVDVDGDVVATIDAPDTGTITVVASVITDQTILAANANRKGVIIFNDSTSALRLALSNVNATVSYSIVVAAGGTYLLGNGDYVGVIKGTWVTANGNALVTELV